MRASGIMIICAIVCLSTVEIVSPAVKSSPTRSQTTKTVQTPENKQDAADTPALTAAPDQSIVSHSAAPAASYQINWQSINSGGLPAASANYAANASVGQSAIGMAASASYAVGAGYWYGITSSGCSCPYQCDFDESGTLDALDLNGLIDALFFGGLDPQDAGCPTTRGDFNNDGAPDALDLNDLIDHLFFGGHPPIDPCAP